MFIPRKQCVRVAIVAALDTAQLDQVRQLFQEYAQELREDLCFQNFHTELTQLPGPYAPPQGCLLLATVDGEPAGCCALRPLDDVDYANACEMKRLYVRPAFRGMGLGRRLMESMLEQARAAGFACGLLETLDDMEAARALYAELGFEDIAPYYFKPIATAHYLKVTL